MKGFKVVCNVCGNETEITNVSYYTNNLGEEVPFTTLLHIKDDDENIYLLTNHEGAWGRLKCLMCENEFKGY